MRLYPYAGVAGDFMVWNGANNIATYGLVEHRYPVLATSQVSVSVRVCSFPSNSSACRDCGLKEHETSPFSVAPYQNSVICGTYSVTGSVP